MAPRALMPRCRLCCCRRHAGYVADIAAAVDIQQRDNADIRALTDDDTRRDVYDMPRYAICFFLCRAAVVDSDMLICYAMLRYAIC